MYFGLFLSENQFDTVMSFVHHHGFPNVAQNRKSELMPQPPDQLSVRPVVQYPDSGVRNAGAAVASDGGLKRMEKRTMEKSGMYASPEFKRGYLDSFDGKPLEDNATSQYSAGWQARKEYAAFMESAGFEQIDGEWVSAEDRRRGGH